MFFRFNLDLYEERFPHMSSWELSEISETIVSVCKSYLLPVKSINILKFTNLALNTGYLGKVFTIEGSKKQQNITKINFKKCCYYLKLMKLGILLIA